MKFLIISSVVLFFGVYAQNNAYFPNNANPESSADSQGNAYSQGNGYAQSNAYSQSGVYSQGNSGAGSIYRPCPNFNTNCISQYFSRNSNCSIVNGQNATEPFYAPIRKYEFPSVNVSLTRYDIKYFNILSGRVEEFFVDFASGYTVLSLVFKNLTLDIGNARLEINRRADIPLVEIAAGSAKYPDVAITVVFPSVSDLNLAQVRSTAYFTGIADFNIDNLNGVAISAILKNRPVAYKEVFLSTAPITARNFIQSSICNFGIGPNDLGADR